MIKLEKYANFDAKEFNNVKEIICNSAELYGEKIAFVIKNKQTKEYTNITYKELLEQVNYLGTQFFSMGLKGKRVAIIGKNRYEWVLTHLVNLFGGIVSVPLDKDLQLDEFENSLIRSKADVVVYDSKLSNFIDEIKKNNNTSIKEYINMEDIPDLIQKGKKELENGKKEFVNYEIDENAMNILLFTSGTTSKSKAVMLSHKNIASNIYGLQCVEDINCKDTNIAFLPFHHIFGSTCIILMLACGVKNVFPDGLKYIKQNLNEYKVTVFVGVPILVESIYKTIMKEVEKQGKTKLIKTALKISNFLLKFHIDIRRKIFKSILNALGGELRMVVSGGAAADCEISKGFNDLGITVVQGYGLTETSPVVSAEDYKHIKYGSIGRPMINDTIEIVNKDEDGIGEIRVKGPNVMLGYYEMEEETKTV